MAQFDVYANPNPDTNIKVPYLLDIQADLLATLTTRIVVPVYQADSISNRMRHLNPTVSIKNEFMVLSTAELAAVPKAYLGKPITNLSHERINIINAIHN